MQYFPFFIDIENHLCVIAGGGTVALRKVEKLLPFKPRIKVIAENICNELAVLTDISIEQRKFCLDDIDHAFMVIAATDDKNLNKAIHDICIERNIFVNSVDDIENCSFIFPALVKGENYTAAVSTSGKSPIYARYLRENIENTVDDDSDKIIEILHSCRSIIKQRIDSEEKRKTAFEYILKKCIENSNNIDIETITKEAEDHANEN